MLSSRLAFSQLVFLLEVGVRKSYTIVVFEAHLRSIVAIYVFLGNVRIPKKHIECTRTLYTVSDHPPASLCKR